MQQIKERVSTKTLALFAFLSIILTCFWDIFIVFLPPIAYCTQSVSSLIPTPGVELLGGPFIMFLIMLGLIRIPSLRRYLTTTNLVYFYVMTLSVSYFANVSHPWAVEAGITIIRPGSSATYNQYLPTFVGYSNDVASQLIAGLGSVGLIPWGAVLPGIVWRFLLVALFGGISLGVATISRQQWIDFERLPFPQVMLAHSVMVNVENSGKREWLQRKPFIIGILTGFVLAIPLSMGTLFPWFPDIYGWRSNTCGPGSWQFPSGSTPSDTPWNLGIAKHLPLYVLLLLVPLHSLFSVLIYTAVLEISLFVSYYGFGAYTGIAGEGFCGKTWCSPNTPYSGPPLYFAVVDTGAALGLFVITIILDRSHIIKTLKAAFGSIHSEEEKLEPISYKSSWIVLITSYVLLMGLFMFTGFSLWVSFVLPLAGIITWMVMAQLWARIGFATEPTYFLTPGVIRMFVWPSVVRPDVTSTDIALVPTVGYEWIGHQSMTGWGGSLYTFLASYRMANLTGVNPKNVLKVALACIFISMLTTEIIQVAVIGTVGAMKFSWQAIYMSPLESYANGFWTNPTELPIIQVAPYLIIGFVFMVVTRYLCMRFLWLPDPIVAIVSWAWVISLHGVWFACLVAWIIKSIVLRVGGSKLYEQQLVPFVGGFMLGDAFEVLITALTAYSIFQFGL